MKDNDSSMSISNNKRIAKNTLFLYFRMLLIMGVNLFAVRIVLQSLGVVDYGIFNVVGGVVVMFSFLSNTMASASQRFFAYDIGKSDFFQLKKTFSATVTIYLVIALLIFILAETIGFWFLNTQMNIPFERMSAANWVYQFSIFSFLITIMTVPYNAIIIAREKMSVFAYISMLEALLKLGVVFLLYLFTVDKLKLYSVLLFLTTLVVSSIYFLYCRASYKETHYRFYWESSLFKTLVNYSGWNLFGAIAGVFNNQGVNILLNIFFGPIVNTARGIAFQINYAINQFVLNFHTAVKPQITKYYASGENEQMINLLTKSSKYSFFLLFVLSFPVLIETNFILSLWLGKVPKYVVVFTQLTIINALIDSLTYSMQTAVQATGRIKLYQIIVGGMMILNLPISYIFLKLGYSPEITIYISIINSVICIFLRLKFLKRLLNFSILSYVNKVLFPIFIIVPFVMIFPLVINYWFDEGLLRMTIQIFTILTSSLVLIYFVGLTVTEKAFLKHTISAIYAKITKKSGEI